MSRELVQQWLQPGAIVPVDIETVRILMEALRTALSEPVQEPVAHLWQHCDTGRPRVVMPDQIITADATWFVVGPLYLHPPQRKPLTDEEIWREYQGLWPFHPAAEPKLAADIAAFARAIERAHGIKQYQDEAAQA